jgi:hypothetical protein
MAVMTHMREARTLESIWHFCDGWRNEERQERRGGKKEVRGRYQRGAYAENVRR